MYADGRTRSSRWPTPVVSWCKLGSHHSPRPTPYLVGALDDPPVALCIGMVTLEWLEHPAGLVAQAMTDQDFDKPTAQLAQSVKTRNMRLDMKRRDTTTLLLVR